MKNLLTIAFALVTYTSATADDEKIPLYKYRYETEDVMKSAASNTPLHGYHVVEGGYYPEERFGRSAGFSGGISQGGGGGGGYLNNGGYSSGGFGGGYSSGGLGGGYSSGISQGGLGYGRGIGRFDNRGIGYGGGSIGGINEIGHSRGGYVNPRFVGGGSGIGRLSGGGIGGGSGGIGIGGIGLDEVGGSAGGIGIGGGAGRIGYGGGGIGGGSGLIGLGGHHGGHGGEILDKTVYNDEKKNLNDESYEKINSKKGETIDHGENGFSQGKTGLQNSKGDSAYYNDEQGGKKIVEDGKTYSGGDFYNQEGKNADEKKEKSGHKKGHVVKGFKSSHHKDETGRTEEYYDEAHDEGDNFNFNGRNGKFGEGSQATFKGGHDNSQFNADERKKQGHYDSEEFVGKNNADQGQYGQKKYAGSGQVYGVNNGIDQQSLLGHQESSRIFKHHPYYVPFYH